jgi:uncharacterized protein (UPF0332 family)
VKKATGQLLEKGARAIHAAETLLGAKDADFAAGRAYYAMFYAAQPLLHEKNLRFRKHAGVHAAFGEHFAKTGVLEPKFHRWLLDAFDKRLQGDYGIELIVTVEDVQQMIEQAREFLAEARRHLGVHE